MLILCETLETIARCMIFIGLMLNGKGRHAEYLAGEPLGLFFLLPQFVTVVRERGCSAIDIEPDGREGAVPG